MYSPNIPRCQHIKTNGTQCESPRCAATASATFTRSGTTSASSSTPPALAAPAPPSTSPSSRTPDSVQVGLMQVMRLTLTGQLDSKTAGLMLYALQTASLNLRRTNFEPLHKTDIVIDPRRVDETLLGENVWENEDFEDPEEDPEEDDPEEDLGQSPLLAGGKQAECQE
jgi:hypothetical protein